ncbi:MAG: endo alpha-1,4 polygalactosaminidase [Solirubrobacteraceae bacterium]
MPRRMPRLLGWVASVLLAALSPAAAASAAGKHWRPGPHPTWYWQLQGRIDNSRPAAVYDVDGFDTSAHEVRRLHAAGRHVVCYIDAGTWERWRPDARAFPASVLGRPNGWPGERWLDIRQGVIRQIMARRFRRQCQRKHFDAVEADNIDEYQAHSGFPITARDQLAYDEWIARRAHALGLAVLQKNDPGQARTLEPYFDGVLSEQCNQYSECSSFEPYLTAGKPVLDAEYRLPRSRFCARDVRLGIMAARYNLALDGRVYEPCW